jgi:hypothetical protein
MSKVTLKAIDGTSVSFDDKCIGQGRMKDVFFTPDKSQVVAFYRGKPDYKARERLIQITGAYRESIFNVPGPESDYWRSVFCWPTKILEHNGSLGLVAPTYAKHFYFEHGSSNGDALKLRDREKQGKWFASALHQGRNLDVRERGTWLTHIKICLHISRAVHRMHLAGLAHSDLSYKNVLVDPKSGSACIIDIDGLVVPGKFAPDVSGTPDFVAPEVMRTLKLDMGDPAKCLPKRETDAHALAVLVYMYLLYRHPLKGRRVWDLDDSERDEELAMGENALFIEDRGDRSNRPNQKWLEANEKPDTLKYLLPYANPDMLPYTAVGPYLSREFERAFGEGLHNPARRPSAADFEMALLRTLDLVLDCSSPQCRQRYFVYDNSKKPSCAFCKTPYGKTVPVLNLYSNRGGGRFTADNHRLVGYHNQSIHKWHINSFVIPTVKTSTTDKVPVGYISWFNDRWMLVNQGMPALRNVTLNAPIRIGEGVALESGLKLLLDDQQGGRLAYVQVTE